MEFLRATADKPIHACRLVSKVEQTDTKLETMYADDGRRRRSISMPRGIGLSAKINDQNVNLLLDTGAGGIMVSRSVAEKAGLTRVSALHYGGIGDKGLQNGYTAVADHIRIGELEFQDCKRPEDTVAPKSLNSEGEEQANAEQKDQQDSGTTEKTSKEQKPATPNSQISRRLPRDRYVAPEMVNWTKVFRFGHALLVPTSVNDSKPMLFGLDTGAFSNILSLRAGRQVAEVSSDYRDRVNGLSGAVDQVYSSKKATLAFGHIRQSNLGIITFDLSNVSGQTGTEVSGFLGFEMLRKLELKLDYRDGLVDFEFDPKRAPIKRSLCMTKDEIAYLLLRVTLGANLFLHGFSRLIGNHVAFATHIENQLSTEK